MGADESPPPDRPSLPPGRQPWDPANGIRIGAATGALLGAGIIALTSIASVWVIVACGAIGGAVGFWSQRRRRGGGVPPRS